MSITIPLSLDESFSIIPIIIFVCGLCLLADDGNKSETSISKAFAILLSVSMLGIFAPLSICP